MNLEKLQSMSYADLEVLMAEEEAKIKELLPLEKYGFETTRDLLQYLQESPGLTQKEAECFESFVTLKQIYQILRG